MPCCLHGLVKWTEGSVTQLVVSRSKEKQEKRFLFKISLNNIHRGVQEFIIIIIIIMTLNM